jgi:hypothetical protein
VTTKPQPPATKSDPIEKAQAEHARILELLGRMSARRARADLLEDVRALSAFLPSHFRSESEPGGMLAEIVARTPDADRAVASLRDEHEHVLVALEALHAELEAEEDGVVEDRLDEARQLARSIQDHEAHESKLIASLAYRDVGGGD